MNVILPHATEKLKQHIAKECEAKNIRLVYKQLDGTLDKTWPSIVNTNDLKKYTRQQKE